MTTVSNNIEDVIFSQKSRLVNKLFKMEVSLPVADLTVEQIVTALSEKYTASADKSGVTLKENAVRVSYAPERSFIIKPKKDKKNVGATILEVHNEFGEFTLKERSEKSNELAKENLAVLGNVAKGIGKGVGKAALGVVNAAADGISGAVQGDVAGAAKGLAGNIGSGLKGAGDEAGKLIGNAAKNSFKTTKEQIKFAKDEFKQAKEENDPEKLYTACVRIRQLGIGGITSIVAKFTAAKAKKEWKAKETASLPAAWEEVFAELKAKASVN